MMFCPKCKSIMMPKQDASGKTVLVCGCGYSAGGEALQLKEKTRVVEEKSFGIAEDKEILPLTEADCPKCGHKKAYFWTKQTRSADEPETKFYKCEKCKHTWRDYK